MVRVKHRYILFEVIYENQNSLDINVADRQVLHVVKTSLKHNFGDYGGGLVGHSLWLKYYSVETGSGIIRCHRDHQHLLQAALTLVTSVGSKACYIKTLHVSGTIQKCQLLLVKRNRELVKGVRETSSPSKGHKRKLSTTELEPVSTRKPKKIHRET